MNVTGQTHIGLVRKNNQDALSYGSLGDGAHFAVVCDGMGGANGGNIASTIAAEVIAGRIQEGYRPGMSPSSVEQMLSSAMALAEANWVRIICRRVGRTYILSRRRQVNTLRRLSTSFSCRTS